VTRTKTWRVKDAEKASSALTWGGGASRSTDSTAANATERKMREHFLEGAGAAPMQKEWLIQP